MKLKSYTIANTSYEVMYSRRFTDPLNSIFLNNNVHKMYSPKITSEIAPDISSEITSAIAPDISSEITSEIIPEITPEITVRSTVDSSIRGTKMPGLNPSGIIGLKTEAGYTVYMGDNKGKIAHLMQATSDWKNIDVLSSMPQIQPFEGSVGEVIFRTSILFNHGIVVHAAAIDYEGKGIIFSAPSGTGKSTQANLWNKHKGARILNGDRPCLRISEGHVEVYGTPWSGTSKQFLNHSSPLSAIIMLEQANTNEISQLSAAAAIRLLVPRCYLPYYCENLMTLALENIGQIIKKTPIYLLKCRPDIEAVELVAERLK